MMRTAPKRARAGLGLIGAVVLLAACAESKPSAFYTLSSLSPTGPSTAREEGLSIGVGPIAMAQYLDRPQIVTRASPNRLELAEFHKWAEPLKDIFSRVVADNLSALMASDRVVILPRRRPGNIDYQVEIDVTQFDIDASGETILTARWSIFDRTGKDPLYSEKTTITDTVAAAGEYEAGAASMSRAIAELSREIAAALKTVTG